MCALNLFNTQVTNVYFGVYFRTQKCFLEHSAGFRLHMSACPQLIYIFITSAKLKGIVDKLAFTHLHVNPKLQNFLMRKYFEGSWESNNIGAH